MGLIRMLIIIFLVYYIVKFFVRIVFPMLLNYIFKNNAGRFFYTNFQGNHPPKQEGEVNIKSSHNKDNRNKDKGDEGEYIDYEEVK